MRAYAVLGAVLVGCSRSPQVDAGASSTSSSGSGVVNAASAAGTLLSSGLPASSPGRAVASITPGPSLPVRTSDAVRQGSTVVLAELEGRPVALVADEDARAVHVIDRAARRVVSTLALGAAPAQMLGTRDGKVLVALRGAQEVVVLGGRAGGALGSEASIGTAAEPFGLALTPDGGTVLVASAWGRRLEGISLASYARSFSVELPREPRAVLVTDDGASAFVSHAAGSVLSRVALTGGHEVTAIRLDGATNLPSYMGNHAYRSGAQGFGLGQLGGRILAPQALMNAGLRLEKVGTCGGGGDFGGSGMKEHRTSSGVYGGSCDDPYPVALQSVAVVKAAQVRVVEGKAPLPSSADGQVYTTHYLHQSLGRGAVAEPDSVVLRDEVDAGTARQFNACALPRGAVVDEANQSLLVACQGHDVVLELDATVSDPARHELRRFAVPAGATGVAIDPVRREALVFSQFDRALVTLPLGAPQAPVAGKVRAHNRLVAVPGATRKDIEELASTERVDLPAAGSLAEPEASGRRLFHALGDERISGDGRACASCHPDGRDDGLAWAAPGGARQTMTLAGRHLELTGPYGWSGEHASLGVHLAQTFRRLRGKGLGEPEVAAVLAYVRSLPRPARDPAATTRAAKGRELFESSGCLACHGGPAHTDGLPHDVRSGGSFDTPSLALVGGTAPYFHDGRYQTLRALLLDSDGKMGSTSALTPADLDALEVYLGTL